MSEVLTVMAVHAHPDDEAISTGGVLARYADEGLRTVVVTCTGGEVGEIADSVLATPETLADVRRRELERACEILRVGRLHMLGYRDSGMMMGTPDNEHPSSFYQASLEEATGRLVALVRRDRPQVLVTYDERGFYGHPDHIRANQITVAAFDAAGDPACWPEMGAPWRPVKLYYTAVGRSAVRNLARLMKEAGIEAPFEDGAAGQPEIGIPDELITTRVDVSAHVERKRQALMAHGSQMGPEVFFAKMPPPSSIASLVRRAFGSCADALALRAWRTTCLPGCEGETTSRRGDRDSWARFPQRRVHEGIHHPAHDRLGLAVGRAADVLEDDHRLDAVDDRQRLQQAPVRPGLQAPVQGLEIERRKTIELAEQQRAIAFAEQSKLQSEAQAAADQARARAVARRSACLPPATPRPRSAASGSRSRRPRPRRRPAASAPWRRRSATRSRPRACTLLNTAAANY